MPDTDDAKLIVLGQMAVLEDAMDDLRLTLAKDNADVAEVKFDSNRVSFQAGILAGKLTLLDDMLRLRPVPSDV